MKDTCLVLLPPDRRLERTPLYSATVGGWTSTRLFNLTSPTTLRSLLSSQAGHPLVPTLAHGSPRPWSPPAVPVGVCVHGSNPSFLLGNPEPRHQRVAALHVKREAALTSLRSLSFQGLTPAAEHRLAGKITYDYRFNVKATFATTPPG